MKKAVKDGIFCLFTASFHELDGSGNSLRPRHRGRYLLSSVPKTSYSNVILSL